MNIPYDIGGRMSLRERFRDVLRDGRWIDGLAFTAGLLLPLLCL